MVKKFSKKIFGSKKSTIITIVCVFVAVVIIFIGGAYLYLQNFMDSSDQSNHVRVYFTITRGEGVRNIAKSLEEQDLIKNDLPLLVYLKLHGLASDLEAGNYMIPAYTSPLGIVDIITNGKVASETITIPEGWTNQQIANYLATKKIVSAADFMRAVKENYNYSFLNGRPAGASLEGYLFPDTYQISRDSTAQEIIKKMLDNFQQKYDSELLAEIKTTGMSEYQVLTLASIVEKEVAKPQDRKVVAGIFLTRLKNGMALQSDVTLQYFLGENIKEFTTAQTQIPSPYNTYLNKGLPFGPICNPSLESVNAVIFPQYTDYQYFIAANGVTYYAKTLAEQDQNEAKYLDQ